MKRIGSLSLLLLLLAAVSLFPSGAQEADKEIVLQWPSIWVAKDSKAPTIQALVDQFNADHLGKIRVVIEPNPDYDGYRNKINTMMAAGQVPDLFVFNPDPTSFTYYQGDLLMDFAQELKGDWGKRFVEGTIDSSTRGGMVKSIPYELGLTPVWYNSDLFANAGVGAFPKTFDEFWTACEKLKTQGTVPTSQMTGGTNAWTSMLWYSHMLASLGGPAVWSKPLGDPMYVRAAELLLRMYSDGNTTKDAVGGDAGVSGGHYLAGRTAVFINGPWYIGRVRTEAPAVYQATRVAPAPAARGGRHGGQIGFLLSNLAAANTTDPARRDAVLKFMDWMTLPENVKTVSKGAGSLFCIKTEFAAGEEIDPLQKQFMDASAMAAFVVSHFQANYKTEVVAEFGQALGKMALGRATPAEFVQALEAVNR
jgi:raffinose/stachyose/melibiose transport system substrate-binding protein